MQPHDRRLPGSPCDRPRTASGTGDCAGGRTCPQHIGRDETVWVKHQPWAQPSDRLALDEVAWNLWRVRQRPYQQLDVGDHVLVVSAGGPAASVVLGEVEVDEIVRARYATKSEAFDLLRQS